jgi:Excalibur calcium-binding domain
MTLPRHLGAIGLFMGALIVSALIAFAATAPPPAHANDPKDCSDFNTQKQAQRWFHKHHPHRDPAGLDADHDGWACESNPCPCSHHRWKTGVVSLTMPGRHEAVLT